VFPEPQAVLTEAPVLLGIDNRKMSKSYGNAIELGADADTVRDMVGRMITDPLKQRKGDPGRPEICNVFCYDKLFGTPAERISEIDTTCRSGELGCRDHKDELAERIVEYLRPFRERRAEALADRGELERMLAAGGERAREIAVPIMDEAREAMGL
jgi:tryptophanyl-tRNA synthetase